MSDKLPRDVDGPALVRALTRSGFVLDRQSGSHAVLIFPEDRSRDVVVPIHPGRALATGTLAHILKRARLTPEDLRRLL